MESAPPEEAPPEPTQAPPDEPPSDPIGTNITGSGPADGFGLGRSSGSGGLGGNGTGRGGGNRFGQYNGVATSKIRSVLTSNRKTRSVAFPPIKVRLWVDENGRITRVQAEPTGNADVDAQLRDLMGQQLPSAPPEGMKMPIVLRTSMRRPS